MAKYRKKPVIVEAYQWHGEFNNDVSGCFTLKHTRNCKYCGKPLQAHGTINTLL